jgi:hypothetical protein
MLINLTYYLTNCALRESLLSLNIKGFYEERKLYK